MRELQLWSGAEGFAEAFPDIVELTQSCRFTDCRHETEPGCAVRRAVESGRVDADRLASYLKLAREAEYQQSRTDEKLRRERQRNVRAAHRAFRKIQYRRT
jgi:ribosome biogenesis GTPase